MTAQTMNQQARTSGTAQDGGFRDPTVRKNRALAMVELTVRSILFDRKTMALAGILVLLLGVPLLWHQYADPEGENAAMGFFLGIMAMIYLQFIVLYTCFLYASALLTAENDDRTMTYLISRPIPRSEILLYKYIGYLLSMFTLFAIPIILNYLILAVYGGVGDIFRNLDVLAYILGGVFLAVMVWGALFVMVAAYFKNPMMPGFFYCIIWESFIANLGGALPKATVTYYVRTFVIQGLVATTDIIGSGEDSIYREMSMGMAVFYSLLMVLAFLGAASVEVNNKDFY